jgi:hypothetical protein
MTIAGLIDFFLIALVQIRIALPVVEYPAFCRLSIFTAKKMIRLTGVMCAFKALRQSSAHSVICNLYSPVSLRRREYDMEDTRPADSCSNCLLCYYRARGEGLK